MSAETKRCTKCQTVLPLEEFNRQKTSPDGRRARCRSCTREDGLAYGEAHREQERARARRWREENPKPKGERVPLTPEERRERARAWQAEHAEEHRARARAYHLANPHRAWESSYRKRSRRAGFTPVVESFTKEELIAYWNNGERCLYCDEEATELEHLFPVSLGGQHTLENCALVDARCNAVGGVHVGRHIRTVEELQTEFVRLKAEGVEMIEQARAGIAA